MPYIVLHMYHSNVTKDMRLHDKPLVFETESDAVNYTKTIQPRCIPTVVPVLDSFARKLAQ